jgi:beta-lactamase class D
VAEDRLVSLEGLRSMESVGWFVSYINADTDSVMLQLHLHDLYKHKLNITSRSAPRPRPK